MLTTNDVAKVVETILSIPGMNEMVKMDVKMSRKNLLLLSQVISRGLSAEGDEKSSIVLSGIPKENLGELKTIATEMLEKGGLKELNEKLNSLSVSK